MKLYNTLTKKTETIAPLKSRLRIYSCGPTVYDHIHIGNLSSFIFADILRRVVQGAGFEAEHVMNFTDVDDKTIRRSRETYPSLDAKAALKKLTEHYSKIFLNDMKLIGNDIGAMTFIKATASIPDIKALIKTLHTGGFAYIADDGVYFSIAKYRVSGKIYGQLLELNENNVSTARIDNDEYDKESAHDFALWKTQKDGEPAWDLELDGQQLPGRPGWHIECSAMSKKTLGQPFDIHSGGVDLIFPHHENEIAQSTAGQKDPHLANLFVHNEHLLIEGRKMSKSLKNFYTLEDVVRKGYEPLAFRLMMLQSHYQSQANFTWESLDAAKNRLEGLRAMADMRFQLQDSGVQTSVIQTARNKIQMALQNNLSTPEALAYLNELATQVEAEGISNEASQAYNIFLVWLDNALGLQLASNKDIGPGEKKLIEERLLARAEKDWTASDNLRDMLEKKGLGIRDTPKGTIWFRV